MRIFIVGAGEVGFHIATSLAREGHDLVVIEADAAQAQKVQAELDVMAIQGDGCQPSLLKEHGIEQADLFFSVSDADAVNLLAALTARGLGAKQCVARLGNPQYGENPLLLADENIIPLHPERLVAEEILGLTRIPGVSKAHFFADGSFSYFGRDRRAMPTSMADRCEISGALMAGSWWASSEGGGS